MTDEELKKANFIDGEMQKRFYANGEKFTVEDVEYVYDVAFAQGRKEVTYMKASEYDEYLNICRTNEQLKAELEQWRQECQDAQIKSHEEGFARTTLQIKYSELKKENEGLQEYRKSLVEDIKELQKENKELKAQIPQWHDLRKCPDDLPKEDCTKVLFITKNGREALTGIYKNGGGEGIPIFDTFGISFYSIEEVIAWCELPTYKE